VHTPFRTYLLSGLRSLGSFVSSATAQAPDGYALKAVVVSSTTDDLAGVTESLWGVGVAGAAEWQVAGPFSVVSQLEYAPRGIRQRLAALSAEQLRLRGTSAQKPVL
jgi:hypothetical protein